MKKIVRPKNIKWTINQLNRNVFRITIPAERNKKWEHWTLVSSDRHWDNPDSDHKLQLKHLMEAKERGADIIDAGDFFCAMQGKWDKRASKSKIKPEHRYDNYLDRLVNTGADFFEPYAHYFGVIGVGNHEQSIVEKHETHLIERLVGVLNDRSGSQVFCGSFSGWVIYSYKDTSSRTNNVLHYDHGYGGGGPVTADMIQHQRRSLYLPDADIVVSGHTHDQWTRVFERVRLDPIHGVLRHDSQTHIKIPTYKDEYKLGLGGWATATKGMPPKPKGAWWLRHYYDPISKRFLYDVIRAQ